jgi:hypothetical protein
MKVSCHVILKYLLVTLIGASFFACEPNVLFEKAMPPEIDALEYIPEVFHGIYICDSDSSRFYVNQDIILNERYMEFETTLEKVRETEDCSIIAGGLYLPGFKMCVPYEHIGEDSIKARVYMQDTVFIFSEVSVAKYYKSRLFLNYLANDNIWITYMITPLEDGTMHWELIEVPDKLQKIKEITHEVRIKVFDEDTRKYIINPTLVEFDKILEKEYTSDCDYFTPINFEDDEFRNIRF